MKKRKTNPSQSNYNRPFYSQNENRFFLSVAQILILISLYIGLHPLKNGETGNYQWSNSSHLLTRSIWWIVYRISSANEQKRGVETNWVIELNVYIIKHCIDNWWCQYSNINLVLWKQARKEPCIADSLLLAQILYWIWNDCARDRTSAGHRTRSSYCQSPPISPCVRDKDVEFFRVVFLQHSTLTLVHYIATLIRHLSSIHLNVSLFVIEISDKMKCSKEKTCIFK